MSWRLFSQIAIIVGGLLAFHMLVAKDPSLDDFYRAMGSIVPVLLGWGVGQWGRGNRND